jgi:hypothetical protein
MSSPNPRVLSFRELSLQNVREISEPTSSQGPMADLQLTSLSVLSSQNANQIHIAHDESLLVWPFVSMQFGPRKRC